MQEEDQKTRLEFMNLSDVMDENTDLIPLLTTEDEEQFNSEKMPDELPILPLRNMVLFPGVVIPITVGRDKSIRLVKEAYAGEKIIGVISQVNQKVDEPKEEHLYKVGTVARILRLLRMPDGNTTVIIQGKRTFKMEEITQTDPYLKAKVTSYSDNVKVTEDKNFEALIGSIRDVAISIINQSPQIPSEANIAIKNIESPAFLINFISSNMNATVPEKQKLLEVLKLEDRAGLLLEHLSKELQLLQLKNDIQAKVKTDIDQQQREFFLNQQIKTIQEELGGSPAEQELKDFEEKAKTKKWGKEAKAAFEKEIEKLKRMNPASSEFSVQLNYLDTLVELPWNEYSKDNFDLKRAQKILNRDHYGLEKVKERIMEHLAILKLKKDMKSPILCLYGPPGVGKTSLGRSVAEALERKYVRMSLGGLRDEAEIRGHRRTYIGAMPGRILQNLKKVKTSNPVFVLDEIDKLGSDYHGDPSSAMLEVLDPEQNFAFHDNFVELDYDLSKVMFIATANNLNNIQPALRDRMEIIEISGYTVEEKVEIAHKHILPKLLKEHGLKKNDLEIPKEVLEKVVESYTMESGVRSLEKKLAKIIRNAAKSVAMEEDYRKEVGIKDLHKILGPGISKEKYSNNDIAGVVTGLAWTSAGGDILFIETSLTKGTGKLTLTGNLGDVMKESATLALEYLKSHAHLLKINSDVFDKWNIHLHVPEGATPKDGPSAGITILTAIASLLTQRQIKPKLAMTGEITLRGNVLPVGGIKEKILAAKRADITEIILCADNKKDIEEIDKRYLKGLKFHYVKKMHEVLDIALLKNKVKDAIKIE